MPKYFPSFFTRSRWEQSSFHCEHPTVLSPCVQTVEGHVVPAECLEEGSPADLTWGGGMTLTMCVSQEGLTGLCVCVCVCGV